MPITGHDLGEIGISPPLAATLPGLLRDGRLHDPLIKALFLGGDGSQGGWIPLDSHEIKTKKARIDESTKNVGSQRLETSRILTPSDENRDLKEGTDLV